MKEHLLNFWAGFRVVLFAIILCTVILFVVMGCIFIDISIGKPISGPILVLVLLFVAAYFIGKAIRE